MGGYKVNFDAAFDFGNSRSWSGAIIRDFKGRVLAFSSIIHRKVGSVFGAEALACADALQLCVKTGIQNIIVKGD